MANVELKTERYSTGKFDVLTVGEYPRRVGHIVGARRVYLAETGPISLGYHKTMKAAVSAIKESLGY